MNLPAASDNHLRTKGISLVELLLVIAVSLILAGASIPVGAQFLHRQQYQLTRHRIATSLYIAKQNAQHHRGNQPWGVYSNSNQIILFYGSTYASRDPTYDQIYTVNSELALNVFEVVFEPTTGFVTSPTQITLTSNQLGLLTFDINVLGTINLL